MLIDFGGTIDSDGIHWFNAFSDAYAAVGCNIPSELLREAYVHAERTLGRNPIIKPEFTFRDTLQAKIELHMEYLKSHGLALPDACADAVLDYCYARVSRHIETVSRPVLERLYVILPMVLVTNFYGNMHTVLNEFGLGHIFKDVVESSVVGVRKPNPDIFRIGAERLGLEPQHIVMVGDSPDKDIIPAQSIGCHTIWLQGQSWSGQQCHPDHTISSLSELPSLL